MNEILIQFSPICFYSTNFNSKLRTNKKALSKSKVIIKL